MRLTVGELKALLNTHPDELEILFNNNNLEYDSISFLRRENILRVNIKATKGGFEVGDLVKIKGKGDNSRMIVSDLNKFGAYTNPVFPNTILCDVYDEGTVKDFYDMDLLEKVEAT